MRTEDDRGLRRLSGALRILAGGIEQMRSELDEPLAKLRRPGSFVLASASIVMAEAAEELDRLGDRTSFEAGDLRSKDGGIDSGATEP